MLYLWRSSEGEGGSRPAPRRSCGLGWSACCICGEAPKEKVAVDLHLIVLADWDGAHVVFVAKLQRRRWQLTCTSSSLRIGMERMLYLWRSSEGAGGSRPAPHHPCGLGCVSYLGEYWIAAKPPSGRVALHLVGFSNGAHVVFVAKLPRRRWQSTCTSSSLRIGMCFVLRRVLDCS